jgi:hypothetical protein
VHLAGAARNSSALFCFRAARSGRLPPPQRSPAESYREKRRNAGGIQCSGKSAIELGGSGPNLLFEHADIDSQERKPGRA